MHRCGPVVIVVLLLVAAAGCGGGRGEAGPGRCRPELRYDGRTYTLHAPAIRPVATGPGLGTALDPGCPGGPEGVEASEVRVFAVAGVDPTHAVATGPGPNSLFLAVGLDPDSPPADLARYLLPVRCRGNGQVRTSGLWLQVERDVVRKDGPLSPPYSLTIRVGRTGPPPLRRAVVEVHVTRETRDVLTEEHLRELLYEGSCLAVRAHCEGARFVADRLVPRALPR